MVRADIISTIGREYLCSNIENDEFSYPKAYKQKSLEFVPIINSKGRKYENLDIRFVKNGVSVLVETKQDFEKDPEAQQQLSAYVKYEKELTGKEDCQFPYMARVYKKWFPDGVLKE